MKFVPWFLKPAIPVTSRMTASKRLEPVNLLFVQYVGSHLAISLLEAHWFMVTATPILYLPWAFRLISYGRLPACLGIVTRALTWRRRYWDLLSRVVSYPSRSLTV